MSLVYICTILYFKCQCFSVLVHSLLLFSWLCCDFDGLSNHYSNTSLYSKAVQQFKFKYLHLCICMCLCVCARNLWKIVPIIIDRWIQCLYKLSSSHPGALACEGSPCTSGSYGPAGKGQYPAQIYTCTHSHAHSPQNYYHNAYKPLATRTHLRDLHACWGAGRTRLSDAVCLPCPAGTFSAIDGMTLSAFSESLRAWPCKYANEEQVLF